jgi:predicted FMN-binding regulatory protein PaiB
MSAIVGFQMPIDRIESNFRLIQERPAADRKSVADALSQLPDPRAQGAAELIRRYDPDNKV